MQIPTLRSLASVLREAPAAPAAVCHRLSPARPVAGPPRRLRRLNQPFATAPLPGRLSPARPGCNGCYVRRLHRAPPAMPVAKLAPVTASFRQPFTTDRDQPVAAR
jgi:hypothetical protein